MIESAKFNGHTPGPWRTSEGLTRDSFRMVYGPDTETSVEVVAYALDFNAYARDAERDANAALIAAAPDLLAENAALRAELDAARSVALDRLSQCDALRADNAELVAALVDCRAAIGHWLRDSDNAKLDHRYDLTLDLASAEYAARAALARAKGVL